MRGREGRTLRRARGVGRRERRVVRLLLGAGVAMRPPPVVEGLVGVQLVREVVWRLE